MIVAIKNSKFNDKVDNNIYVKFSQSSVKHVKMKLVYNQLS